MAISKDDILKAIEEMSVMDLVDLISSIEEKFGVTAAAAVAAAPAARTSFRCRFRVSDSTGRCTSLLLQCTSLLLQC